MGAAVAVAVVEDDDDDDDGAVGIWSYDLLLDNVVVNVGCDRDISSRNVIDEGKGEGVCFRFNVINRRVHEPTKVRRNKETKKGKGKKCVNCKVHVVTLHTFFFYSLKFDQQHA